MEQTITTAERLAQGASGRVVRLEGSGPVARRLTALGVIPGVVLTRRHTAPAGSPIAFEVGSVLLALRKRDAARIVVREFDPPWQM